MSRIVILPPDLVNQIAAGEVVERPASVIKELVENAIDAGATRVEVGIQNGGRDLRVADNGYGMTPQELGVAFRNHATSKVKVLDDLFNIHTLGFRGEALASIAAIAKVTCISRTADAEIGTKALVEPTGEVTLSDTGCAVGTIMEVRELFYNVPARLKFLKREQTEISYIQETLQTLALSHPEIALQLKIEDSVAIKTSGTGDIEIAIGEVFTLKTTEGLIPFEMIDSEFGFRVWGRTSTPNLTRGSKKWVVPFVNGRTVRCPILGKAIESAYQDMITPGKFPITVLFLEVPSEEVDVNVHPTKKEVKYQRANTIFSFARRAIEKALGDAQYSPPPNPPAAVYPAMGGLKATPQSSAGFRENTPKTYSSAPSPSGSGERPVQREPFAIPDPNRPSVSSLAERLKAAPDLYKPGEVSESTEAPWLPQIPAFKIIGQLAKTYILVENAEGLLIVDQHIAGERVLFERFSEMAEQSESVSQRLLLPKTFTVSTLQVAALTENLEAFEALGFQYRIEGPEVYFTWVPALYNEKTLQTSLEGMLAHLEETGEVRLSTGDVIATAACHSAVRAGDLLNQEQMERIVAQWLQCRRPWTCPHGRAVAWPLSHREIMSFFDRPSLPAS